MLTRMRYGVSLLLLICLSRCHTIAAAVGDFHPQRPLRALNGIAHISPSRISATINDLTNGPSSASPVRHKDVLARIETFYTAGKARSYRRLLLTASTRHDTTWSTLDVLPIGSLRQMQPDEPVSAPTTYVGDDSPRRHVSEIGALPSWSWIRLPNNRRIVSGSWAIPNHYFITRLLALCDRK